MPCGAVHVPTFDDHLVKSANPSFYFVKNDRETKTGHACGKQRLLHTGIISFDLRYVRFECFVGPVCLERPPQILDGFFDSRSSRRTRLSGELSDSFLVQLTVFFQHGNGSEHNLTQSATCVILNEAFTISLLDEFAR